MVRAVALLVVCGCSFSLAPAAPGTDAVVDAAPDGSPDAAPDAKVFDQQTCPGSYLVLPDAYTRYRAIVTAGTFWQHADSCDADSADGSTHPVVLDTLAEAATVRTYLLSLAPALRTFSVGAVQSPAATQAGEGWIDFHDQPLAPALWGLYAGVQQPDDGAFMGLPSSENHQQNVAFLDLDSTGPAPYLRDGNGNAGYVAVCECDGIPVGPLAKSYVAGDINRPPTFVPSPSP